MALSYSGEFAFKNSACVMPIEVSGFAPEDWGPSLAWHKDSGTVGLGPEKLGPSPCPACGSWPVTWTLPESLVCIDEKK